MRVDPYLQFHGRCDEALAFYGQAIGAQVQFVTRFGETPGVPSAAHMDGKVLHAVVRIGESTVLASDGGSPEPQAFQSFALALGANSDAEAETLFAALADGGQIAVPIGPTPFAARFGIVIDRFGLAWNVVHQAGQP